MEKETEREAKAKECLQRFLVFDQRCLKIVSTEVFRVKRIVKLEHMQDFLKKCTMEEMNECLRQQDIADGRIDNYEETFFGIEPIEVLSDTNLAEKMEIIDKIFSECSITDAEYFFNHISEKYGLSSKNCTTAQSDSKQELLNINFQNKSHEKLKEQCIRRYFSYDDKCRYLVDFLDSRDLRRTPMRDMKRLLETYDSKELKQFLRELVPCEQRVGRLKKIHFAQHEKFKCENRLLNIFRSTLQILVQPLKNTILKHSNNN